MLKLNYRVKEYTYSDSSLTFYIAQYRIFGIWMNINIVLNGSFVLFESVRCNTFDEARERIDKHKLNMMRAKQIANRKQLIIWCS